MATPSAIAGTSGAGMPPVPPLDMHCLRCQRIDHPHGVLEVLAPSIPSYTCADADAPALVCVPGLGMDGTCFVRQLPLGAHTDIHLLRPPAYPSASESGLGHFARYVERYIQVMELERRGVILLGSSMGGAVALTVAIRRNIALKGLVLVGTFGHHRHLNARQRVLARFSWMLPGALIRFFARPMLKKSRSFGTFSTPEAHFMLSCIHVPSRGYLTRSAGALRRLDLLGAAHDLNVPTLVLHGTDDRVLPLEAGTELSTAIPDARLVAVPEGGHALFFIEHEPVNAAVLNFIRELRAERKATHGE